MGPTLAPVTALLIGVALLLAGHGLQLTLLPIRAELEGFSTFELGALGSAYYVGFVIGCLGGPYLVLRAGHIRAFAAAVSLASAMALAHALAVDVAPWLVFRAITGACLATLYLIVESWLNDRATNQTRGLIMSAYIVVNFGMLAVGQALVTLYDPRQFPLFAIAALAISLATIPVALTRSAQPAPIALVRFQPAALYRSSPVGVVGVTAIGVAHGAFWSLGAIYALSRGLSVSEAAIFMSCAVIGGAIAQWPAGRLSDRIDRRVVLLTLLALAICVGVALSLAPANRNAILILGFLLGACMLPSYSIAAAHAYDHADRANYVETAAGVLLANGAGSIVGPIVASSVMGAVGSWSLFLFVALVQAGLAAFVYSRLKVRAPLPTEEKTEFDLAATAPVGGAITPEPLNPADPNVEVPSPPPPVDRAA
jgi:MFS family permease